MPGKGGLQLAGKLGEVIRESAQIGLSRVKSHAYDLEITPLVDEQFLTDRDVHLHMPEGTRLVLGKKVKSPDISPPLLRRCSRPILALINVKGRVFYIYCGVLGVRNSSHPRIPIATWNNQVWQMKRYYLMNSWKEWLPAP
jgi:Lon protease-like protein